VAKLFEGRVEKLLAPHRITSDNEDHIKSMQSGNLPTYAKEVAAAAQQVKRTLLDDDVSSENDPPFEEVRGGGTPSPAMGPNTQSLSPASELKNSDTSGEKIEISTGGKISGKTKKVSKSLAKLGVEDLGEEKPVKRGFKRRVVK
jgi:hypothetical protein